MAGTVPEKGGPKETPRRPAKRSPKQAPKNPPPATVDTPEQVITTAEHIRDIYLPRISALTGAPAPEDVTFKWGKAEEMKRFDEQGTQTGTVLAYATPDGTIFLNPETSPGMTVDELTGLIVHETTHEVLRPLHLSEHPSSTMFVEGLADYVKDALVRDTGTPDNHSNTTGKISGGYQSAAAFFQYVEEKYPGAIKATIAGLMNGDATALDEITGQATPHLIQKYKKDLKSNEAADDLKADLDRVYKQYLHTPSMSFGEYNQAANDAWRNFKHAPSGGVVPQPPHLTPHFAAGPNPGISAIYDQVNPSFSPLDGLLATGDILGFDETPPVYHPPPPPGDGNSGTGSGSSSGGSSSSSSSSSGSSAPKYDQYISDIFRTDAVSRTKAQMFASAYEQLWGEPATENYLIEAVKSGMNTQEFVDRERMKESFKKTKTFEDEFRGGFDLLRGMGAV